MKITIHNVETGEIVDCEMTDDEYAEHLATLPQPQKETPTE